MNAPPITSLVVDNEPPHPTRLNPIPPWKAPFIELLGLLKIIDTSQPNPQVDGQRFCFQPSSDLSEISRIFLSVSTSSTHQYDVDLETFRVLNSDIVPPAVTKLQEYANHVLRRVQFFRDRLLERAVIKDIGNFLNVDLFTCPLCHDPLLSCVDCDSKVACGRPECLASHVIPCEYCYEHQRMACHACLAAHVTFPSLIRCPVCQDWCCREDMEWCAGLIVDPALGTEELAELSRECCWDYESIVRSHPPKPGPCGFCVDHDQGPASRWVTCRNSADDMEPDRCPSQPPRMTKLRLRAAYCPECVDECPGCRCACGGGWLCDTCIAIGNKSAVYPYLIVCPRCGTGYCTDPDRACGDCIEICRACKGAILCSNCQEEEEETPGEVQSVMERPKQVVFSDRCSYCEAWTCADCHASVRTTTCVVCSQRFCYSCISDLECHVMQQCDLCGGDVCRDCRIDHDQICTGFFTLTNMPPQYY